MISWFALGYGKYLCCGELLYDVSSASDEFVSVSHGSVLEARDGFSSFLQAFSRVRYSGRPSGYAHTVDGKAHDLRKGSSSEWGFLSDESYDGVSLAFVVPFRTEYKIEGVVHMVECLGLKKTLGFQGPCCCFPSILSAHLEDDGVFAKPRKDAFFSRLQFFYGEVRGYYRSFLQGFRAFVYPVERFFYVGFGKFHRAEVIVYDGLASREGLERVGLRRYAELLGLHEAGVSRDDVLLEGWLVHEVIVRDDLAGEEGFTDADPSEDDERLESFPLEFFEGFDRFFVFLVYGYFAHVSRGLSNSCCELPESGRIVFFFGQGVPRGFPFERGAFYLARIRKSIFPSPLSYPGRGMGNVAPFGLGNLPVFDK